MNLEWLLLCSIFVSVSTWGWVRKSSIKRLSDRKEPQLPHWLEGKPGAMKIRARKRLSWIVFLLTVLVLWNDLRVLALPGGLILALIVFWGSGCFETKSNQLAYMAQVDELPQTLDLLAAGLTSGAPLRVAVAEVLAVSGTEIQEALSSVSAQTQIEATDEQAWLTLAKQNPLWKDVALDLARSASAGTKVVQILQVHAKDARRARRDQLQAKCRTVGVKATLPLVCCFLPAFVLVGVVPILISTFQGVFNF